MSRREIATSLTIAYAVLVLVTLFYNFLNKMIGSGVYGHLKLQNYSLHDSCQDWNKSCLIWNMDLWIQTQSVQVILFYLLKYILVGF